MKSSQTMYFVFLSLAILRTASGTELMEKEANGCEDTKSTDDCEFMFENGWCNEDIEFLKRKCDLTCGWCSESDECVDRANYLKCGKLTRKECNSNPEFYLSRCRKSCNWCKKKPKGAWRSWETWSSCSASCNVGHRQRSRYCLTNRCKGDSTEVSSCLVTLCATWLAWSPWTECSVKCGSGVKTRTRKCTQDGQCVGLDNEITSCEMPACALDGVTFEKWTPCSRSCGGGTRKRTSFCLDPDRSLCPTQYEDCNTHKCPYKICSEYRYGSQKSACCVDTQRKCLRTSKRVVGGRISKPKQFSWMALIELQEGNLRSQLCGGTLIHEEFVVTAAHCFDSVKPEMLTIVLGAISTSDTSTLVQRIPVSSFTIHPNYSEPKNDMAIVRLKKKAAITDFVGTLCLPDGEDTPLDTQCFVAGWGLTDFRLLDGSPNLMEAKIRRLPFDICQRAYRQSPYGRSMDPERMMCAGVIAGGVDTCGGDSGGPLMCQRCSSCFWYLAGVTSFGAVECGAANIPGVYMSALYYEDWIVKFVEQFDKSGLKCKGQ